jgi:hypothetical protein
MAKRKARRRGRSTRRTSSFTDAWSDLVDRLMPSENGMRVIRVMGWTAVIVAAVLGVMIGMPEMRSRAVARDLQLASPEGIDVKFFERPAVLEGDELTRLVETVRAALGERKSPLQPGGLREAAEALSATGWFERVNQVRWMNDNTIAVHGSYVVPVAVVRTADGDVLVDTMGRRLPITYDAGYAPLPLIKNPSQLMPRGFGTPWAGGEVQAGLALLQLINKLPWFQQVDSIDVGRYSREQILGLRTRTCTITWGRPPDETTIQEVPTQQKLDYLDYLHRQYGAIDAPCGGGVLDIRRDIVTSGPPR